MLCTRKRPRGLLGRSLEFGSALDWIPGKRRSRKAYEQGVPTRGSACSARLEDQHCLGERRFGNVIAEAELITPIGGER